MVENALVTEAVDVGNVGILFDEDIVDGAADDTVDRDGVNGVVETTLVVFTVGCEVVCLGVRITVVVFAVDFEVVGTEDIVVDGFVNFVVGVFTTVGVGLADIVLGITVCV